MSDVVVSCFDLSTVAVKPWAANGYTCYCVDKQHPEGNTVESYGDGEIIKVGADIMDWLPPQGVDIAMAMFFPPCTHVAVSGARWFKDKGIGALIESLELFDRSVKLAEWMGAPYFIENPVSTVSTYWREPDHIFQPHEFGGYYNPPVDQYTKRTCLWTGNGFVYPPKKSVEPVQGSKFHNTPETSNRANIRSQTPEGFSMAVFQANVEVQYECNPST